jgi:hypothetical protein
MIHFDDGDRSIFSNYKNVSKLLCIYQRECGVMEKCNGRLGLGWMGLCESSVVVMRVREQGYGGCFHEVQDV